MEIVLRYVGNGAYIAGLPACDLTADMIEASGYTAETILGFVVGGKPLYEIVKPSKGKKKE